MDGTNDQQPGSSLDYWREAARAHAEGGTLDATKPFLAKQGKQAKELDERFEGWPKDLHDALDFGRDISTTVWRGAFESWVETSPKFGEIVQRSMRAPAHERYYQLIADLTRGVGEAIAYGEGGKQTPLVSPYYDKDAPEKVSYKVRLQDGAWKDITQEELVAKMRDPNAPHILFTANHAFLDTEKMDVNPIADNFERLYNETVKDPAQTDPSKNPKLHRWDEQGLTANDSVMVMAIHGRENRFLNLADLFQRLVEIRKYENNPEADPFSHTSPIAKQMVATILKSIVVESDQAAITDGSARNDAGRPNFFRKDVTIGPEAAETMRRTMYTLFSKGGNDGRDAMRLLVHTLHDKHVKFPAGMQVKDIVGNISMMVTGLNEEPLAPYYLENGATMRMVVGTSDTIAPVTSFNYGGGDRVIYVNTKDSGHGHSPAWIVDGCLGDRRVLDQHRMAMAGSLGKFAIRDVHLWTYGKTGYDPSKLVLEVPATVTDASLEAAKPVLRAALDAQGLTHVELKQVEGNHDRERFYLESTDASKPLITADNMSALKRAFLPHAAALAPEGHAEKNAPAPTKTAPPGDSPLWVSDARAIHNLGGIRGALLLQNDLDIGAPSKAKSEHPRVAALRGDTGLRQMDPGDPGGWESSAAIANITRLPPELLAKDNASNSEHARVARNVRGQRQHPRINGNGSNGPAKGA